MDEYYTVSQFAQLFGKDPGNIRRLLISGDIEGKKIGRQWVIPVGTQYPNDKRVKTGEYRNWRKRLNINQSNPQLMRKLSRMCCDINEIYGTQLVEIILYGSYSRGEQTEESDVDIAVVLREVGDENKHDKMVDVVVDYELDLGVTLSVVPIEYLEYEKWRRLLPFYKNIDSDGIVLWKTA